MKRFLCGTAAVVLCFNTLAVQAKDLVKTDVKPIPIVKSAVSLKPIDDLSGSFNNQIKLVFADIDETLLYYRDNRKKMIIPQSSRDAAKKLRLAKIPMILATGRDYTEAKFVAQNLDNDNSYMVLMQGAKIVSPEGKVLYECSINGVDTKKILNDIKSFEKKYDSDSLVYVYVNKRKGSPEQSKIAYDGKKAFVYDIRQGLGIKLNANKIMIYDVNDNKLRALQSYLKGKHPNYNVDISAPHHCEITNINATKGNGIKQLAKILGVDMKNVAIFGDAENDLSMFKAVKAENGLAVAVDNAMDIIKQNANYETLSVYDGGVDYAVNKILENNALLKNSAKCH